MPQLSTPPSISPEVLPSGPSPELPAAASAKDDEQDEGRQDERRAARNRFNNHPAPPRAAAQRTVRKGTSSRDATATMPVAASPVAAADVEYGAVVGTRLGLACAFATAFLWWLAGQQSGLFALGWVALAPMLWALHDCEPRARRRFGFLTGCLSYALINWWIVPTVAAASPMIGVPSGPGVLLGVLAVVLIAVIHGSLVALAAWSWDTRRAAQMRLSWCLPLIFALLWSGLDAARGETALAHAWGALAYTQWRDTALLQIASVVGQHGLTFSCAWFAASLALWARTGQPLLWRAPLAVFALLHLWGAARLAQTPAQEQPTQQPPPRSAWMQAGPGDAQIAATPPTAPPTAPPAMLRVLLVQTNVATWRKRQESGGGDPFSEAHRMTRRDARPGQFDLIVWPETTVNVRREDVERGSLRIAARRDRGDGASRDGAAGGARTAGATVGGAIAEDATDAAVESGASPQMRALTALSRELQTPILTGARLFSAPLTRAGEQWNSALLVHPDGRAQSSDKQRLVPFGERAPYGEYLPVLRRFAPQPEVTPARRVQTLALTPHAPQRAMPHDPPQAQSGSPQTSLGALICFESCFRFPARGLRLSGARALFVLTNDEWSSGTSAPWEHTAMAALRAVENDVSVAQAGNGGLSFAVDRRGRFMVKSSFGTAQTVSVLLPLS